MPTITRIIPHEKLKEFVTVFTDENTDFTISREICLSERLTTGKFIDTSEIESIISLNNNKRAFSTSLKYLSRKKCSKKMLADYLNEKGFSKTEISYALNKAIEYRYIDDEDFAKSYVQYSAGKSRLKIAYELKAKGISEELIEKHNKDDETELKDCICAAEKFVKNRDLSDRATVRKLIGHLQYKGYSYDNILTALHRFNGEDGEEL